MATGKWAGFGEQLGNAIIGGMRQREQREREEAFTAEQQRRTSVLEAIQKANLMMEYDQRYRPVGQEEMTPVFGAGAPFSLPPQGAVQSKSILGMFGDDSMYMPRTKQEDPYKVYESGYVERDTVTGKPVKTLFDKPKEEKAPSYKTANIRNTNRMGYLDPTTGDFLKDKDGNIVLADEPDKPKGTEDKDKNKDTGKVYDPGESIKNLQFYKGKLIEAIESGEPIKLPVGDKEEEFEYKDIKKFAMDEIENAMYDANVPINGEVANFIRGVVKKGDKPQDRLVKMNNARFMAKSKFKLNDQQMEMLNYWIQLGNL